MYIFEKLYKEKLEEWLQNMTFLHKYVQWLK